MNRFRYVDSYRNVVLLLYLNPSGYKLNHLNSPSASLLCFHLDVDVNACRHLQSGQCIYCLLAWSSDVDESLVSSLLELLSGILVLMNRTQNGYNLFLCW